MDVFAEMTQTFCKSSNGTEKIICFNNFKNNVIDIWIIKTKTKWFNLSVAHVIKSWSIAYNITVLGFRKS